MAPVAWEEVDLVVVVEVYIGSLMVVAVVVMVVMREVEEEVFERTVSYPQLLNTKESQDTHTSLNWDRYERKEQADKGEYLRVGLHGCRWRE